MNAMIPFLTGKTAEIEGPLSRFIPDIPEGIATKWIHAHRTTDSVIFDPFGTAPKFASEIARAGNLVIACVNNPITRLLFSIYALSPSREQFQSALSELASSRVGDERLEIHLKNLYRSNCNQCGNTIIAEAFIWDRDANAPHLKIYDCMHCGDSGAHPITRSDIDLAQSFPSDSMNRMRIIERITNPDERERKNVSEALSVYLPRAIYGLVTLINRLEGLLVSKPLKGPVDPVRRISLVGLVINALDHGNNLWTYPTGRARPKQLTSSPQFREINLWSALENAVDQLSIHQEPIEITEFPQFPTGNMGLCIFKGPIRQFHDQFFSDTRNKEIKIDAIMSAIPRHNQAYWTLSALWAGWIWGRESIGEFKSVLLRRRYDWSWHCAALKTAFDLVRDFLEGETSLFGIVSEAEPSFIHSTVISANLSGYTLDGISLRFDKKLAQVHWRFDPQLTLGLSASIDTQTELHSAVVKDSIRNLEQRGEPATYLTMHCSALHTITTHSGISNDENKTAVDEFHRLQGIIENSFTYKNGFIRHGGGEKSLENAILWHQQLANVSDQLSDRVESEVLHYILKNTQIEYQQIDQHVCNKFPGIFTPNFELVTHCIESYSIKDELKQGRIVLRSQDSPANRLQEISVIGNSLHELGERLGYFTQGDNPIEWRSQHDLFYTFYLTSSAEIGKFVFDSRFSPEKSIIVLPGARANLLLYKLRTNFILSQAINQGWRIIKFRHLRQLVGSPTITTENLDQELELDPMTESPAQMRLL